MKLLLLHFRSSLNCCKHLWNKLPQGLQRPSRELRKLRLNTVSRSSSTVALNLKWVGEPVRNFVCEVYHVNLDKEPVCQ